MFYSASSYVKYCVSFFSIHNIVQADGMRSYVLKEKFKINFLKDYYDNFNIKKNEKVNIKNIQTKSSYGRKIKARDPIKGVVMDIDEYLDDKELTYAYDDELNILGILIATNEDDLKIVSNTSDEDKDEAEDEEEEEIFYNYRSLDNRRVARKMKKKAQTPVTKPNVFIQLYDNNNGFFLKKFAFHSIRKNCTRVSYQLFIDHDKLIVIEKAFQNKILIFSLNSD